MVFGKQCDPKVGDVIDEEEESQEEAGEASRESAKMRLLRSVFGPSSRPKPELSIYDGNLTTNNLIDWISELEKYFECEEIDEEKRVKFVATRLRGHA